MLRVAELNFAGAWPELNFEIRLGNSIYVYAFHKEKAARLVLLISDHQDMAW